MENKITTNYHTHMYLCKHATGDIIDYVKRAVELGYTDLGISDHGPFEQETIDLLHSRRMNINEFNTVYLNSYNYAKKQYHDKINLKLGIEIEYIEENKHLFPLFLEKCDYLLLGQHYFNFCDLLLSTYEVTSPTLLNAYTNSICKAMETNYFRIVAHPDLFMWGYKKWDDYAVSASTTIISTAIKNNVLIEINANGIRNSINKGMLYEEEVDGEVQTVYAYPNLHFIKLAKKLGATFIINDDCHTPNNLQDQYTIECYNLAKKLGLKLQKTI